MKSGLLAWMCQRVAYIVGFLRHYYIPTAKCESVKQSLSDVIWLDFLCPGFCVFVRYTELIFQSVFVAFESVLYHKNIIF